MEQATYREGGQPLSVTVESGFAKPGFYEVFLWTADRQTNEKVGEGDFSSPTSIQLPATAGQDGRIVHCIATVDLLGDPDFAVTMTVSQGGARLASDAVRDRVEDVEAEPTVSLQILIRLVKG